MQAIPLDIIERTGPDTPGVEIELTFRHFISYLEKIIIEEDTVKRNFFKFVLKKFKSKKQLSGSLTPQDVVKYKDELTLAYSLLMPVITREENEYWALGTPLTPSVFFGTNAMYRLLKDEQTGELKCGIKNSTGENHKKNKLQLIYSFILKKLYNFSLPYKSEMVHTIEDEATGMPRYFRVNIDTRFVEVVAKEELPPINFEHLRQQQQLTGYKDWSVLYELLPLHMFKFEGFSIITITDITAEQSLENIKSIILNRSDNQSQEYYNNVITSLQTLAGTPDVMFDLLPALRVNNRLVFNDEACMHSLLVKTYIESGISEDEIIAMSEQYLADPKVFFYRDLAEVDVSQNPLLKAIKDKGIVAYALMPVYYNNSIAGILEAYSTKKDVLDENVLGGMKAATPLLAQFLQKNIDGFNAKLVTVIREKFTSLQPAVQWKFNEVAWHFLRDEESMQQKAAVEKILFKNVYPLYAAVDIRNSTIERNAALKADLTEQITVLIDTIRQIKKIQNIAIADELIYKCQKWLTIIQETPINDDHIQVKDFLDYEIKDFLQHFHQTSPALAKIVDKYFDAINEETGVSYTNRRQLETSIQAINGAINQYLEIFKIEAQNSYPCYFEKFRTDGIEFDIYIGQSITPQQPFNVLYLKNLRLWQLTAMAAIARLTHGLLPTLSKPLQTTQLIFIHSNSIDISFRNDERRFDVEGGYNIRYQVIKKRIDKANIKDTNERLTQPGKIALVYFNKKEADEYVEYINYLQEKGILKPGIEYLDLEELQGVSGLKALRVDVALEESH